MIGPKHRSQGHDHDNFDIKLEKIGVDFLQYIIFKYLNSKKEWKKVKEEKIHLQPCEGDGI